MNMKSRRKKVFRKSMQFDKEQLPGKVFVSGKIKYRIIRKLDNLEYLVEYEKLK
jgi:hypothetical protein